MASIQELNSNIKAGQILGKHLPRIHSHIRGLFSTSKLFRPTSIGRPPIARLHLSCHLSEWDYVWVYIIVNPVSVTPLQCYHVEEAECSHVAAQNCLDTRSRIRQIVSTADQFKIGRTQTTSIIKRKAYLLLEYDQNNSIDRKRMLQNTGNEDVNIICWEWFQTARSQNIRLRDPNLS